MDPRKQKLYQKLIDDWEKRYGKEKVTDIVRDWLWHVADIRIDKNIETTFIKEEC